MSKQVEEVQLISLSDVRTATDGRLYFVAEFRPGFGQRSVKRTFWQQFRRDAKGVATKEVYWDRATPAEAKALKESGEKIEGRKVTHTVEKYLIGDNTVSTYSTIVFPDEREEVVFFNQNHPIVDEVSGEVVIPAGSTKRKATLAPEGTPAAGVEGDFSMEEALKEGGEGENKA